MTTNKELADTFSMIADILEIKGEIIYKILAYRRAAETLVEHGRSVQDVWKEGGVKGLRGIPGVGEAIAEKIDELLSTGQLGFLEKLKAEVPASLIDMLKISGVGPKKAAHFWKKMDITTVEQLKAAALAGKLRDQPGMGEKSEQKILESIEALSRRTGRTPLGVALPAAQELLDILRKVKGVVRAETGGSLRRMKPTVGDLDLLVSAKDSAPVMAAFTTLPGIVRVLGQGEVKSSIEFENGLRAQLWVHPPHQFGTALQYATGSKEHNVRLREIALDMGLSLSDHSFLKKNGKEIFCATEEEVYETLGMQYVPPEMREDRGEVQLARKHQLPKLIEAKEIKSDLHSHSTWSDGRSTIKDMAKAAIARGLKVLAITDHSHSLGIANGLSPERLLAQRKEIDKVQKELGDKIMLLQGAEIEIKADGTLDHDDAVLASLDIVVASLHVSLRQPREQSTQRLINAIRNPNVDIIGHPTGRLIPDREGADLDMDAVLKAAKESGVALEINANPQRLDLDDVYSRRAIEMGIPLAIDTDAHAPEHFDLLPFGIATARRGWVTAAHVINCWDGKKLRSWLAGRGGAVTVTKDAAPAALAVTKVKSVKPKAAAKPVKKVVKKAFAKKPVAKTKKK
jgi:DNA polymerase (family X)